MPKDTWDDAGDPARGEVPLVRAIVREFDQTGHTATVQPLGSGATYLHAVPVSKEVGVLAAGERVLVVIIDSHNAGDAVVLCRYGASDGR
ncbi:MAG: hypothetical protein ACYC5O_16795 [Anaerolineae bacterium]